MPLGFSIIGSTVAFDLFLKWATQGPLGPLVIESYPCIVFPGSRKCVRMPTWPSAGGVRSWPGSSWWCWRPGSHNSRQSPISTTSSRHSCRRNRRTRPSYTFTRSWMIHWNRSLQSSIGLFTTWCIDSRGFVNTWTVKKSSVSQNL